MTNPNSPQPSSYDWGAPQQQQPQQQQQQFYPPMRPPHMAPFPVVPTVVYSVLLLMTFISSFLSVITLRITGSTVASLYTSGSSFWDALLGEASSSIDSLGSVNGTINWWGGLGIHGKGLGSVVGNFREEIFEEIGGAFTGLKVLLVLITLIVLALLITSVVMCALRRVKNAAVFGIVVAAVQFFALLGALVTGVFGDAGMMDYASVSMGAGFWFWTLLFIGGLGYSIYLLRSIKAPANVFVPQPGQPGPYFPPQPNPNVR